MVELSPRSAKEDRRCLEKNVEGMQWLQSRAVANALIEVHSGVHEIRVSYQASVANERPTSQSAQRRDQLCIHIPSVGEIGKVAGGRECASERTRGPSITQISTQGLDSTPLPQCHSSLSLSPQSFTLPLSPLKFMSHHHYHPAHLIKQARI